VSDDAADEAERGRATGAPAEDEEREADAVAAAIADRADREGLVSAFDRVARALPREQVRALDDLAGALSHELRGPLAAIGMWSHVLGLEDCDDETRERALEAIEASVRAQSRLIDDLLDYSRATAGTMRLDLGPTSIGQTLTAAIDGARDAAEAKDLRVAVVGADGAPLVRGDRARLGQAIACVLDRAIDRAVDEGALEVVVGRAGSGLRIAFRAVPTRPPIAADREPDLGLGVARQILELHGGSLLADEEAAPSTFALDLPITRMAARSLLAGVRVLVVEDDEATREGIATVLGLFGAEVRAAGSSREALALLDEAPADALVSDLSMPGEDGYAFVRAVRARPRERGGAVPALALSAQVTQEASARVMEAGFQRHLAKPIDGAGLALAIDDLLQGVYPRAP
jgi:CheY-like chemotaxis protein